MLMDLRNKYVLRILTVYILGLMPFLVNLLINLIAGTTTYDYLFHVGDLMYFVITVCGTALMDVMMDREENAPITIRSGLGVMFLVTMLLVAALFLGMSSHNIADPPAHGPYDALMHRLRAGSLIVAGLALLFTVLIEIGLCKDSGRLPSDHIGKS
jgi:hypothetical protein